MSMFCNNNPLSAGRKKKPFNTKEKSDIQKLKEEYHLRLEMMSSNLSNQVAKRLAELESIFNASIGEIITLKPDQYDRIGSFLAAKLGWKRNNPLNPTLNFSQAGEVRQNLLETKRVANNMLDELGKLASLKHINELKEILNRFAKEKNIPKSELRAIFVDTLEIGEIPKLNAKYGNSSGVRYFQNARYQRYLDRMEELGFSPQEIEILRNKSFAVASAFDEMRVLAEVVGVPIDKLQDLGYFPRIPTRDFYLRLKDMARKNSDEDLAKKLKFGNTMSADWQKSRETNWFIPEDINIASEFLGISTDEMMELLDDPTAFRNFLHENLTASQLDTLVDSGVFAKLPMTGREVFDYMSKQYELPYKHINEMFIQDPLLAIEKYSAELKTATANSAMAKMVAKDGLSNGWAITKSQLEQLPENIRKNFRPLGSLDLSKWYTPEELSQLDNLYVHKVVADQWKSILDISSSPTQMGNFARIWTNIMYPLNKSTLLSQNVLYLGRLLLGGVISSHALGTNLASVPQSIMQIWRSSKIGFEAFDDKRVIATINGKGYTERELFRLFYRRRGNDIAPGTSGIKIDIIRSDALNPLNMKKAFGYLINYSEIWKDPMRGVGRGLEYFGSLAKESFDKMFAPIALAGNFIDLSLKWAAFKSLMDPSLSNRTGQFISGLGSRPRSFDNFDEAFRHIDEYFYMYDEVGTLTDAYAKFVRPFGIYAALNPPAMMRYAMRSPEKFLAYHRLLQLWNYSSGGALIPEGGFAPSDETNYPVVMRIDQQTGEAFTLLPNSYDPLTDSFTFYKETGEVIQRVVFGQYAGTTKEQMAQVRGEGIQEYLQKVFNETYYGRFASLFTGIDPLTNRKRNENTRNTYFGIEMSPVAEAFLGFLPPIDALNRMNPGGIFGTTEIRGGRDEILQEGKPSIFGYQRTDGDRKDYTFKKANPLERVLMALGANIRAVNIGKNMGFTYAEIERTANEIGNKAREEQKTLASLRDKPEFKKEYESRKAKLEHMLDVELQLRYDLARVLKWLSDNNIPTRDALKEIRDRNLEIQNLPLPGFEKRRELIIEGLQKRQEYFGEDNTETIQRIRGDK